MLLRLLPSKMHRKMTSIAEQHQVNYNFAQSRFHYILQHLSSRVGKPFKFAIQNLSNFRLRKFTSNWSKMIQKSRKRFPRKFIENTDLVTSYCLQIKLRKTFFSSMKFNVFFC